MSFALYNLLVKLVLVTALIAPGMQNLLQGTKLAEVQAAYSETVEERSDLQQELADREAEYRTLLRQIDALKGGPNTLQNRMELEGLLRDSRQLAARMEALQRKIRGAERRLHSQRAHLVAAIDARMNKLEAAMAHTSAGERRQIVDQLNDLRAQRQQFTAPLPDAPSNSEVSQTLAMGDELDGASPDDLLAAADELQDTGDQVKKRLGAIRQRIEQLRQAKLLARRARTFSAEDRFFDETDRSRFIARYEQNGTANQSGSGDMAAGAGNNGTAADPNTAGDPNSAGDQAPPTSDRGSNNGTASPGAGMDGDGAGGFENGGGGQTGQMSDEPANAPGAPEAPTDSSGPQGQGGDVFGAGDDLLIDSQAEPDQPVDTGFESDDELDARIQSLEAEQRRLQKQAEELENKAHQLRERAHDSLD